MEFRKARHSLACINSSFGAIEAMRIVRLKLTKRCHIATQLRYDSVNY